MTSQVGEHYALTIDEAAMPKGRGPSVGVMVGGRKEVIFGHAVLTKMVNGRHRGLEPTDIYALQCRFPWCSP